MNGENNRTDNIDRYVREVKKATFIQDEEVEGSYRWNLKFYRRQAQRVRLFFRTFGLLAILLSIVLPIVAALGNPLLRQALWLPVVAAAIAHLTSVNAFYRWDQSWRGFINTQLESERLHDTWEINIA